MIERFFGKRDFRLEAVIATYISSVFALICVAIYLASVLRLSNWEWVITGVIALIVFSIFAFVYLVKILASLKEIAEYREKKNVVRVVEMAFEFPWRQSRAAFFFWIVGGLLIALLLTVVVNFTVYEAILAYYGALLGGTVGSALAYFFFRHLIKAQFKEEIEGFYSTTHGEILPGEPFHLRRKFMLPLLLVLILIMGFIAIVSYRIARDSVLSNLKNLALAKTGISTEEGAGIIEVLKEEGWSQVKSEKESPEPLPQKIRDVFAGKIASSGAWVDYRKGDVYMWLTGGEKPHVFLFPWENINKRELRKISSISTAVIIFSVLVVGIILSLFSGDLSDSINQLREGMKRIKSGERVVSLPVVTDDELQTALNGFLSLSARLFNLLSAMRNLSESIKTKTEEAEKAYEDATVRIGNALQFTRKVLEDLHKLKTDMDELKKNTETSSHSVDEISSSVIEMDANLRNVFDIIGDFMDKASSAVELMEKIHLDVDKVKSFLEETSHNASAEIETINSLEQALKDVQVKIKESQEKTARVMENAEKGSERVVETIELIRKIKIFVEDMMGVIENLISNSREVGNILSLIDDLADETNLLSLNASIIAAQAGQHGRAFAVVADQVRELSERTSISTRDVRRILEDVISSTSQAQEIMEKGRREIEEGVKIVAQMEKAFGTIMESARIASEIARDVSAFTSSQVESFSGSLGRLSGVIQAVSEADRAIEELSLHARRMHEDSTYMKNMIEKIINASAEQEKGGKVIAENVENIADMIRFLDKLVESEGKIASALLDSGRGAEEELKMSVDKIKMIRSLLTEILDHSAKLVQEVSIRKEEKGEKNGG